MHAKRTYERRADLGAAPWSAEEEEILRRGRSNGLSYVCIADELGRVGYPRSAKAVETHARKVIGTRLSRTWSEIHARMVRDGYESGLSSGQIAMDCCAAGREGTTRNAVIGLINRMVAAGALQRRGAEGRAPAAPHTASPGPQHAAPVPSKSGGAAARRGRGTSAPVRRPSRCSVLQDLPPVGETLEAAPPEHAEAAVPEAGSLAPTGGVPLFGPDGAAADACRWPVAGEGADLHVCGARSALGRSYCAEHLNAAFRPATPVHRPAQPVRGGGL